MTDRTTKALLLALIVGLWANVATGWLRPVSVQALGAEPQEIAQRLVQFEQYSYRQLARTRTFRRAVQRIVEGCEVTGFVDGDYLYSSETSC
jgi:hypothetical protein